MIINYLLLVHQLPEQLLRLVERLSAPDVNFIIHVDKSTDSTPFKEKLQTKERTYFVGDQNRIDVFWGDVSVVEATMALIKKSLEISGDAEGYGILMSGQDYPIKSNKFITDFFRKNAGIHFITSQKFPIETWRNGGWDRIQCYNFHPYKGSKSPITIPSLRTSEFCRLGNIKPLLKLLLSPIRGECITLFSKRKYSEVHREFYGGSQWWALPFTTLRKILDFVNEHPDVLKFHRYTQVPDEIFVHTIIAEFIDPKWVMPSLTHVRWEGQKVPSPVVFKMKNLEELLVSNCLFARKFNQEIDNEVLNVLDQQVL
ncbi:beta-1,6-N-acetylglucosaminyltransferase [Muriicola marianensis]|uniref:beta-1,6-N-acetylglucosaminyltransferase n=1 Tax=Muriicola marianensis TaxID=1324801 RepID=UPI00166DB9E9|nr:beta-1,6-N-acetylglucosaminyltransferase [Muriicola marianensis]